MANFNKKPQMHSKLENYTIMTYSKQRSRESRAAIERLYITMRHLFIRGYYKPMGISGESLKEALLTLKPEIYGKINDPERVELHGLLYVAERLPRGIEECKFIQLVAREGFELAGHVPIIPLKRRRNCYRIDKDRMYVEMSRGRSDIYDILTHLTFLYIEAEKIKDHALDQKRKPGDTWERLREVVSQLEEGEEIDERQALVYLSNVLGRTITETKMAVENFEESKGCSNLYHFVYWLGQLAIDDQGDSRKREIRFSAKLREVVGHHVYGEIWAEAIKRFLAEKDWMQRPIHIISANLHSVMNALYGFDALADLDFKTLIELAEHCNKDKHENKEIGSYAREHGLYLIKDVSGTNLSVQIIDTSEVNLASLPFLKTTAGHAEDMMPVLIVMDYAFGEQAYECMDELLKPFEVENTAILMNVQSVNVMGKAGILEGNKGDLMIPTAHVFEGTADNYPFENDLKPEDFHESNIPVFEGAMITVLGTSLQNRDVLQHFLTSTWNAVGLEMEGAHYQKAIQSAARIRKSISADVKVRYAYYASDNPLVTGGTLSSGSLGAEGVKPTYWVTGKILEKILGV